MDAGVGQTTTDVRTWSDCNEEDRSRQGAEAEDYRRRALSDLGMLALALVMIRTD
jgi:hypothetical protein